MEEFKVTTQRDLHDDRGMGEESEWIEFAALPIVSGQIRVSDPMFFRDLPPSPTFQVEPDTYRVLAKLMTYPGDRRVSRLRACSHASVLLGARLGFVGVDFAQVGVFDPVILDEAGEKLSAEEAEKMVADLDAINELGLLRVGPDERALMPIAVSGFGDGTYPIFELTLAGKRSGVEVVFIGPEVTAE